MTEKWLPLVLGPRSSVLGPRSSVLGPHSPSPYILYVQAGTWLAAKGRRVKMAESLRKNARFGKFFIASRNGRPYNRAKTGVRTVPFRRTARDRRARTGYTGRHDQGRHSPTWGESVECSSNAESRAEALARGDAPPSSSVAAAESAGLALVRVDFEGRIVCLNRAFVQQITSAASSVTDLTTPLDLREHFARQARATSRPVRIKDEGTRINKTLVPISEPDRNAWGDPLDVVEIGAARTVRKRPTGAIRPFLEPLRIFAPRVPGADHP